MTRSHIRRNRELSKDTKDAEHGLAALEDAGMSLPSKPKLELPTVEEDFTEVSDQSLMETFRQLTVWSNYVNGALALAATKAETAEKILRRVRAGAVVVSDAKTVTMAEAEAEALPEVIQAKDDYDQRNAYRRMLRVVAENLARDTALISRELTRRVGSAPYSGRTDKWSSG